MYQLNDSALLAQCARIKTMIEETARNPEYQEDYYARSYHHWQLNPPVQLSEIEKFEEKAGIELPIEYVYYLTQVGSGGACPGTFFSAFKSERKSYDGLNRVSEQLSRIMSEKEWEQEFGEHDYPEDGTLYLCGMDLTFIAYLIVTGPLRGRVVYLDYDGDMAPMWPKNSPDFLTWCENYYSELLAGYNINPTWKFMWQEPGDTNALIHAFNNQKDKKYQKEVLYSFCKFQKLTKEAACFLKSIEHPEFQKIAAEVLKYFEDKESTS